VPEEKMEITARQYLVEGVLRAAHGRLNPVDLVACETELFVATDATTDARTYVARMADVLSAAKYEHVEAGLRAPWPAWKLFVDLRLFYRNAVDVTAALCEMGTRASATDVATAILKRQWFELAAAPTHAMLVHNLEALVAHVRAVANPAFDASWALCYTFQGQSLTETLAFRGLFLWQRLCPAEWRRAWRQRLQDAYCWQEQPSLEQEDAVNQMEKAAFAASPTFAAYSAALVLVQRATAEPLARLLYVAETDDDV
jgi:hypothetical protein